MKRINFYLSIVVVFFITNSAFSQMTAVSWKEIPSPATGFEAVFSGRASINQMSNGKWYFTYADDNSQTIFVKRFNTDSQTWTTIYSQPIVDWLIRDVDAYVANDKLYFGLVDDEETLNNFSLWSMDLSENVNQLLASEISSFGGVNKVEFVVVNDKLFLASVDGNGASIIDTYDLTSNSFEASTTVGIQSSMDLDIAVDHSDNSLVVCGVNLSDFYFVAKAQIGASLNFAPLNSTGDVTSAQFPGSAFGQYIRLVEKRNNSPELVFLHNNGASNNLYRLGLYNNSSADMVFTNPDLLGGASVAQFGSNTYVSGLNNLISSTEMWEVDPSGNKVAVAADNFSAILSGPADGLITAFGDAISSRACAYYHIGTGNGTGPGYFKMTNNPPAVNPYDVGKGCVNNYNFVIKGLTFDDLDGDNVEILSGQFTSSQATVVDPTSIFAYENSMNEWDIELFGTTAGTSQISMTYTDGFDTLTESFVVEIVEPAQVSFTTSTIEFCESEEVVDMNDYVDSVGGIFYLGDYTSEDGIAPFDTLDYTALPYTDIVFYDYTDVNGCSSNISSNFTIYENPSSVLNVANSTCGNSNGAISATVNSPNGTYNNYWNTGDQGVTIISGLSPGTYYHNIIDEKGCIGVDQANVQASDVVLSGSVSDVSCHGGNDGSIQLSINGANGPYNVIWSSGHSTPTVNNLSAGNYTAVVSNGNGCTVSQTFTISQPTPMQVEYLMTYPDCGQSNGAVEQSFIQGGNGGYSYQWSNGGGTSQDMIGVPAGNYGLQVTDANGCTLNKAYQLNPNTGASANADVTKAVCGTNSGSIELDVFPALGETVTSIEWSNGATTEDIYNLAPGVYTCQIQQSNGCTSDFTWQVIARRAPRPDICIVTVDTSTTTNLVVWEKPATNIFDIDYYKIYRETNVAGQFQLIDTVHYSNISVFNDVVASPLTRSWRYRISAVTSCGTESVPSVAHKTIHLVMDDLGNGDFRVVWDNYEGFAYNSYDLLRYTDLDGEWVTVASNIPFNALPNDTVTPPSTQNLNYMIEVVPPGGTCTATEGKAPQDYNSSRSNKPRTEFNPGEGTGDPNNSLIKYENEDFTVAMYPNPTDGQFEVALYHNQSSIEMDIEVVNIQGKGVYQSQIQNGVNYIDLGQVESGVYFVSVQDGQTTERLKIVVK
tara:strand:- start:22527 stop:26018 length:3492 start_codon:yes stop_codon:yes gene_type:complete